MILRHRNLSILSRSGSRSSCRQDTCHTREGLLCCQTLQANKANMKLGRWHLDSTLKDSSRSCPSPCHCCGIDLQGTHHKSRRPRCPLLLRGTLGTKRSHYQRHTPRGTQRTSPPWDPQQRYLSSSLSTILGPASCWPYRECKASTRLGQSCPGSILQDNSHTTRDHCRLPLDTDPLRNSDNLALARHCTCPLHTQYILHHRLSRTIGRSHISSKMLPVTY